MSKLQYAKFLAATLAYLAAHQHDAVGLIVFDEEIREHRRATARAGGLTGVLHAIERAQPGTGTDLRTPFERFRQIERGRGLVVVLSDFYCAPDAMIKAVQPLAYQGQDVILLQVLDRQELDPQLKESALLEDLETGEAMEVSPIFMRSRYREKIQAHLTELRRAAARAGADYKLVTTDESLDDALREYLLFRQRRG